jgi:hypothetical protein
VGNAGEETTIKIYHAQKLLEGFDVGEGGEFEDGLGVGGNGREARGCVVVAKEFDRRLGKLAFDWVDVEAIGSKDREESVKMAEVF